MESPVYPSMKLMTKPGDGDKTNGLAARGPEERAGDRTMRTLVDDVKEHIRAGSVLRPPYDAPFAMELVFTATYRRHMAAHPAALELECLRVIYPACFRDVEEGDLLVGRVIRGGVGFAPEGRCVGYYCMEEVIRQAMETAPLSPERQRAITEMLDFWRQENTQTRLRSSYPRWMRQRLPSDDWVEERGVAFPLYRIAGTQLDYAKLLALGIPGLKALLAEKLDGAPDAEAAALYRAMLGGLDLLAACMADYLVRCEERLCQTTDAGHRAALERIVATLGRLPDHAPDSFHEATQLVWLYALISGTWNYGRMDVYLGDFLARDLERGTLSETDALAILQSTWRLIKAYDNQYNNRVTIGGKGRPNEANADRFADLAIEATRTVRENQPQLTLRFYRGQNPELMALGLTAIGEGCTLPMLYNDDVNVPAVAKSHAVSEAEAAEYLPFGCGEYMLNHRSVATPSSVINLPKALEAALHDGIDPRTGKRIGIRTGPLEGFDTFERLWAAYTGQLEYFIEALAFQQKLEYDFVGQDCCLLYASMLYDDCIGRGRALLSGGVRYLDGTMETYGNINAADALTAIDQVVFKKKLAPLEEVVQACDSNFRGHERLRQLLLDQPKYGNDDECADGMARRVHDHVCRKATEFGERAGLRRYLVVVINNWANVILGRHTAASADGRLDGEAFANGNNPAPGRDTRGVTAFLNSLAKLDPSIHAGAVQNMKFSPGLFREHRPKLEALLDGYFSRGGTQAMISVVNQADLEAALAEPEKWGHLMVRVGGFSARFIDLPRDAQLEIIRRTAHR